MQAYNDPVDINRPYTIAQRDGVFVASFEAMASPCEILIDCAEQAQAEELSQLAAHETWRIEQKFSRYRSDGIIPRINHSQGTPVQVDEETAMLIDFAYQCFELSDGLFDITSGVLRQAWKFDGSDNVPSQSHIDKLVPLIGLGKAQWHKPFFTLAPGMEIDFGGIGKEYAVDRVLQILTQALDVAVLVNFGGDIAANKPPQNKPFWGVGIEDKGHAKKAKGIVQFKQGGIATSGDAKRFLLKGKKRYGHILNPKTGWPIAAAPNAITVLANSCVEAGILSTLAMLQGKNAEKFLQAEGVQYRVQR